MRRRKNKEDYWQKHIKPGATKMKREKAHNIHCIKFI